ncbi:MAG: NAD-dependent epimerase/dehydratase family protein [Porphyromonadaceae bacterium]|nr:MAG: NAD-dependent epimerase/dehydratase family protein [Porphyromonadaceae bacterium]
MILVTGSTGLLGGHVVYALLQKQERVAALKRPSAKTETLREIFSYYTNDPDQLMERIDWRTGDMLDKESLVQAMAGISGVINCAAIVSFNPRDRGRLIDNNIEGTRNLAEVLLAKEEDYKTVRREERKTLLIHISSTSALGDGPGDDPKFLIDEDTPRDPNRRHTGYSVSKYESEQVLRQMGLNVVILNPGIILGPGQWGKGSSQLFVKAWQGLKYYPYGGTGYVDVRDVTGIISEISYRLSVIGYEDSPSSDLSFLSSSGLKVLQSSSTVFQSFNQQRYCLVGANLRYRDFFNLATDEFGKPNPPIYAGKFLSGLVWRADTLRARITGRYPLLTRETAEAAQHISFYSADKIRKALDYRFRPVEETIEWVTACYRRCVEL